MNPDALHMVADARGVPRGERSYCAVCGSSPFPMGRLAVDVVTPMFSDRPVPTVPEIMAQEAGRPKSGDRW